jgi:hypothetical protein
MPNYLKMRNNRKFTPCSPSAGTPRRIEAETGVRGETVSRYDHAPALTKKGICTRWRRTTM